ncbi:MAG: Hsp20/alpha crystallin family protein [Puniceicoccales bacterium]
MSNEVTKVADTPISQSARRQSWRRPRYEVKPGKDAYELKVYLPGVPKAQAEVTIEKDQLLVTGRRNSVQPEGAKAVHEEIRSDDFRLQLHLNVNIDPDRISAQSENGVLAIQLPLAEESKPRAITVE